tara:strand:- start:4279 stop:4518 length:240 start_codon:yes stop_codon:yes gene_type:complete
MNTSTANAHDAEALEALISNFMSYESTPINHLDGDSIITLKESLKEIETLMSEEEFEDFVEELEEKSGELYYFVQEHRS